MKKFNLFSSGRQSGRMDFRQMAEEFHETFGHPIDAHPLPYKEVVLCIALIKEETDELIEELWNYAQTGIISPNLLKERGDTQYVLNGLDVRLGLDDYEITRRVHESNMSKLMPDGSVLRRDDGKVLKGPNYKAPNLEDLVP